MISIKIQAFRWFYVRILYWALPLREYTGLSWIKIICFWYAVCELLLYLRSPVSFTFLVCFLPERLPHNLSSQTGLLRLALAAGIHQTRFVSVNMLVLSSRIRAHHPYSALLISHFFVPIQAFHNYLCNLVYFTDPNILQN